MSDLRDELHEGRRQPRLRASTLTEIGFGRLAIAAFAIAVSLPAYAQMFVWKDPETGNTRMSNLRPTWYRNPTVSGPRTQLILNGAIIDDTATKANDEQLSAVNKQIERAVALQREEAQIQALRLQQAKQQAQSADLAQDKTNALAKPLLDQRKEIEQMNDRFQKTVQDIKEQTKEDVQRIQSKTPPSPLASPIH